MSEHLDMQTPNWANLNSQFIAERFPNCVTETADGIKIDFDLLKQELSADVIEGNKERYRLEWPGKKEAIVTANLPTTKTLRPIREESVDFDNTENLYIEGDNLEVLKLLQESYLGKIKMIYIDPPYNTGKDFVYKDNFAKDANEELLESGQKDEYNQRLVVNPETAGRYHSDWLTMMYPRLKLARNLLTDDGVIFISIDDNEVQNLRKISDEIFGEGNFLASFIWEKRTSRENRKVFSVNHDYFLAFAKNKYEFELDSGMLPYNEEVLKRYKNPDNDERGNWQSIALSVQGGHGTKNQFYDITTPSGRIISPPSGLCWRYTKDKLEELIKEKRIWFGESGENVPRLKLFLSEINQGLTPHTLWTAKEVGTTDSAKRELNILFDDLSVFETPKSLNLIKRILEISSKRNDFIVLDFFSGSATTSHSVMKLNSEDKGKRKYILVQIPEIIDENSEAGKAGFKSICEIGKERIRKAANIIKEETKADIDYGFRVYRLDKSNMQNVYYKPQDYLQASLELFADNVKPDRSEDDLLAQVMLDWGLPLSLKIQQENIAGKLVFKVAGNSLFACFDKNIDEAFAKELAKESPLRIVFKDSGFKDDTAKTNVKQLLKQLSPNTEMKVL
jgi:adenine-specific DNA-methyltransferase